LAWGPRAKDNAKGRREKGEGIRDKDNGKGKRERGIGSGYLVGGKGKGRGESVVGIW
jgi:hypothetical protein